MALIQWNIRGFWNNYQDLLTQVHIYNPGVICLQETFSKNDNPPTLRGFTPYNKPFINERAIGGIATFIRNDIIQSEIPLNTQLQAQAVRLTLNKTITVCNIYLPPSLKIRLADLNDIINQLPKPILFLGDFNAHSALWGNQVTDQKGKLIEDLLNNHNLSLLNDKSPTYLHLGTGSKTSIDLSIASANIYLDFSWKVLDDLYGSDHFPILLQHSMPFLHERAPKWNFRKADWLYFQELCREGITNELFVNEDDPILLFTAIIQSIMEKCIPQISGRHKKPHKPWFNDDCKKSITLRKQALETFSTYPDQVNMIAYKRLRAVARKTIKQSKKTLMARICLQTKQKDLTKENMGHDQENIWQKLLLQFKSLGTQQQCCL